ncbi:MAG: aminomethyl-transferring glycine dehydrogenase subunit GcvPA [Thermodesulfobacteriota bacterium]
MPYLPHTERDIKEMLDAVGVGSLDELFEQIPPSLRMAGPLNLPKGLAESELVGELTRLAGMNASTDEYASFLGAGSYHHYIPSVVRHITSRSEFSTSYTPYQPEVSQGTLQAIFEYQTLMCQLTGMEVSNASMYDGASATAEAVLMAARATRRSRIVMSSALHPEYRETVATFLSNQEAELSEAPYCAETGSTLPDAVAAHLGEEPTCLVIQQPNFFGAVEGIGPLAEAVHAKGGLLIVVVTEPVSLGLLTPPGALGADIVVGEGQAFGNATAFGGPALGFFATKEKYVRQMPGRIVGETTDGEGRRSFCLTLSTREQHIRREKATSNICTNEGLCALAATIFLSAYGKMGLMKLARLNLSKAHYLKNALSGREGIKVAFSAPTFNEFVIELLTDPEALLKRLLQRGIIGGIPLRRFYPELSRHLLVCATEINSREEMDMLVEELSRS